jgi:hypothetical protein
MVKPEEVQLEEEYQDSTARTGQSGHDTRDRVGKERRYRPAVSSILYRTPRQGNMKVKKEKIATISYCHYFES